MKYLLPLSLILLLLMLGCPGPSPSPTPSPSPGPGVGWEVVRIDNHPSILPVAVAIFDMDDDLDQDVVSAWRGAPIGGGTEIGMIVIHFQQALNDWDTVVIDEDVRYIQVNSIAIGDVNLDTNPDIVCAAQDRIVYLRAPDDPIDAEDWEIYEIAASIADEFIAWFDVDVGQIDATDGLDIAAALADDGRVVWFQCPSNPDSADGWILVNIDNTTRTGSDSVLLIDLDLDTDLDVVSTAPGEQSDVISWYEQPKDPVDDPWTKHPMSNFAGATRFDLATLDNDLDIDLAVISPTDQRVAWLPQPDTVTNRWPGWVLTDFSAQTDGRVPTDIAIGDIDGNTQNDVIVSTTNPGGIYWFTPKTDNRLSWIEYTIDLMTDDDIVGLIDVGDMDNDTDIDVVAPIQDSEDSQNDRVNLYENLRIEQFP
ncbi:MAG: hypothetical protein JSV03_17405 [Planctomycetota bacterium]|nr:MAG: hypothetical protein JSV03_17405 [Planctomycetota bacterium]